MITLENRFLKLNISKRGGQWTSLLDKESQQENLFQGNQQSWTRQAPFLFPIVGRLIDNSYIHHGELFKMAQHGFLRDMDFNVVSQTSKEVVFEIVDTEETRRMYPFEFKIVMRVSLSKNKIVTQTMVSNPGTQPLYFNFGAHPGFIVNQKDENFIKVKFQKQGGRFVLEGPYLKEYHEVHQTDYLLTELDLNKTFILDQVKQVTLETPVKKISMKMKPAKYMGLWSPVLKETNILDDVVCLEPWWGIADCIEANQHLRDKKGIIKLLPDESQMFTFEVKIKNKDLLPAAIGPYELAREVSDLVVTSGQLPINPQTGFIESDQIEDQTRQSLKNVKAVLSQFNLKMSDIIKTTVFLKDMNHFSQMNDVYAEFFKKPFPARSAVEVARLPKDALVEIEVIAQKKKKPE